ncbi:septation ring formation regulator EzrA [Halalkalibacter hemicellulosilyticus]|uniref:Septation ring formation regulator EzrA n=1 Tax=Halalkalibacter hemicellulosilyticusJCM 9152 TaxID=1236971 RepID=W4QDR1_9BACI|nr:septation ring formation regulator EzrA [Halalkalibacter hemicellulosilyticus]GAE30082.1 septation ring formation regulator EzrA [Halalkalibacter hemicellulosilyticusJCM 9152]
MNLIYLALIILVLLFVGSSYMKKRVYKRVDKLESWKNDILHRSIPDEIGKVKKLTMAGETEEKFETWRMEWDDIVGVILPDIEEKLFDIEEYAAKNRYNKAKQLLVMTESRLSGIEEQLKIMLADIQKLIESEEQNRTEIASIQQRYETLEHHLSEKKGALVEAYPLFHERLQEIKNELMTFEEATENGSYLEAREYLTDAAQLTQTLEWLMEDFPKLLVQVDVVLPGEIKEIRKGIEDMQKDGYQLESFAIPKQLEEIEKRIQELRERVVALEFDGVEEAVEEEVKRLEELYSILEYEVESKTIVYNKMADLETFIEKGEKEVEALLNETLSIQESYLISIERLNQQKEMQKRIEDLSSQLVVIIDLIENKKQSFTSIRELIMNWLKDIEQALNEIMKEKETMFSMREEEHQSKERLTSLRAMLFDTKRLVQRSNIPGLPTVCLEKLEVAEQKLRESFALLDQVPLELENVNQLVSEADELIDETHNEVHDLVHLAQLSERVIQYGNRFRSRSDDLQGQLMEAEQLFRQFQYKEALDCAARAVEEFEPNVVTIVEEHISA